MRKKIVGAGNTMDSYGDKFLPLSNLSSDTRKDNEESQKREKEEKLRQQKIYQDKVDDIVVDIKKKEQRQQSLQRIENEANKFNKEKLKKSTTEFNEAAQEDAVFI